MALQFIPVVRRLSASSRFIELGLCSSFALFFFWPHPPASLLLLVLAAALAYLCLEIAVALLPLTFPYFLFLLPLSPSGYPAFYIAELGIFICLGAALLRHIFQPAERQATRTWLASLWRQARPFIPPALLLLLGAALAVLVSPVQRDSVRALRQEIIEPLLYFLLILRYLRARADLARALAALILSALVLACLGIGQGVTHLTTFSDMVNPSELRVIAFTYSPNNLGFLLDCAIPILLALAFIGVRRRPADAATQPSPWRDPLRWASLVALLPLLWALYWTDSRGAEVGILAVILCFLFFEVHSRLALLALGGAGILGIGLLWPWVMDFLNKHGSIFGRLYIWKTSLLIIRDHFLLGIGSGSFNTYFRRYLPQAIEGQKSGVPRPSVPHPHNFILDFWMSTGLLGMVAVLWLLGAFAIVAARTYRRCAELPQANLLQRLLLGITGCMLASVTHGLVDSFYFLPSLALTFWFFLGILLVLRTIIQQESVALQDQAKKPGERALMA